MELLIEIERLLIVASAVLWLACKIVAGSKLFEDACLLSLLPLFEFNEV